MPGRVLILCLLVLAAACQGPPTSLASGLDPNDPGATGDTVPPPTAMIGFSWVVDQSIAGMPRPGVRRPLDEDLLFLDSQGIELLVSFTEVPTDPEALADHGIAGLHLPVQDFHPPTLAQIHQFVTEVEAWTADGHIVGAHCGAGLGRTGTFMASLFVYRGMAADDAIAEIRRLRPGSIETAAQERAVRAYASWLALHQR